MLFASVRTKTANRRLCVAEISRPAERDVADRDDREGEGLRAVPGGVLGGDREDVPARRLEDAVDACRPTSRTPRCLQALREPGLAAAHEQDRVRRLAQHVGHAEDVVAAIAVGRDVRVHAGAGRA